MLNEQTIMQNFVAATDTRINRLITLENTVDKNIKGFIEAGEAMLAIRDEKLYILRGFTDWEAYCKATWNFGKSRASQLISAARKAKRVQDVTGLTIPNERVARELNTILSGYNESIQEIALDALSQRGGVLTQERLRNELDVLTEYKVTGHVTRADGEQSALDSAIKTGRKELETAKRYYVAQGEVITAKANHECWWMLDIGTIEIDFNDVPLFKDKPRQVHISVWIEENESDGTREST